MAFLPGANGRSPRGTSYDAALYFGLRYI